MGHIKGPFDFRPFSNHRFDDLRREYRTLYLAQESVTSFREVLAAFRPNTERLAELDSRSRKIHRLREELGHVPLEWRLDRVLVEAEIELLAGELVNLDDVSLRTDLERRHADLLREHGMDHLDISAIRGKHRIVTQTVSRSLYEDGACGVIYGSNHDDLRCVALFEERARLLPIGDPVSIAEPIPELLQVCGEWGLTLDP